MDLPVELVGLLKHAGVPGKKLTWDLQVNSSAVSIKLMWIKAEKTGEITSRAPLTFHQEKKRPTYGPVEGEKGSVGDNQTCVQTQTDDISPSTDETT